MVSVTWALEWDLAIMFNEAYRFLCLGISR